MSNKTIGKFHEKRGDDYFTVVVDPSGEVVQITQRDSIRRTYPSINFFAESAPQLIALIQKAAGIRSAKVEYEYNIEHTDLITGKVWFSRELWEPDAEWLKRKMAEASDYDRKLLNIPGGGPLEYSRRLVKRIKAGPVESA